MAAAAAPSICFGGGAAGIPSSPRPPPDLSGAIARKRAQNKLRTAVVAIPTAAAAAAPRLLREGGVEREARDDSNRSIDASKDAVSAILLRRTIGKKRGGARSRRLLPRAVLEALHERIAALRWESALKVFDLLREQIWYRPNSEIYIKLIDMLGKCKQTEKACVLFQAMAEEGCILSHESFTALLSAYARSQMLDEAFSIFCRMKKTQGCQPNAYAYSVLIKSCAKEFAFNKIQELLSDMQSQGIRPNTYTYNTLIDAYGKANRLKEMEATLMKMLQDRSCQPDILTMSAVLRAFGGSGQIAMMEECYDKFRGAGIVPDIRIFNTLLDSYCKAEEFEKMSSVAEYMQRHRLSWTAVTYNIVIDAFGRAGDLGQMEHAFCQMKSSKSCKPCCITLCSLVRAYGRAEAAEKIEEVLRYAEHSGVALDTVFFNCLIDAYGRTLQLAEMKGVMDTMKSRGFRPDRVTYGTMIKTYESRGMVHHAQHIREIREKENGI